MSFALDLRRYHATLANANPIRANGKVTKVVGLVTESVGPVSSVGSICEICPEGYMKKMTAEVMGFRDNKVLLMPLEDLRGVGPGCRVVAKHRRAFVSLGDNFLLSARNRLRSGLSVLQNIFPQVLV